MNYLVIDHWQPIYASYEHQSEWTTFDTHKRIEGKRNDNFDRLDLNHDIKVDVAKTSMR